MKNKIKSYTFWIGLSGAVVILVQSVGKLFGFDIQGNLIENVIMSICGVLVVLGIVSKPNTATSTKDSDVETTKTTEDVEIENSDKE